MASGTSKGVITDSFDARRVLNVGDRSFDYVSLEAAERNGLTGISRLPVSLKILLENLLRYEDGQTVSVGHIRALASWTDTRGPGDEVAFRPVRILMPDSSGIPLLADLAAMRDAIAKLGGDPCDVNPTIPLDLVVDHSLITDVAGTADAHQRNVDLEFARNGERYAFLRWAQRAFANLRVVPPGNGICHQINLETFAQVVWTSAGGRRPLACPDAMIGTDSHIPTINCLGVLGWGVGGIEAAVAMLGQPIALRIPEVIGCRLLGRPDAGVMTTDVVLTLTETLRRRGVVGTFVEFCGPGIEVLTAAERATLSNMAPEYGATVALFPIDAETLRYLELTGRDAKHIRLTEAYAKTQGLWHDPGQPEPQFSDVVEIDLAEIEPSVAGPRRPQDRMPLAQVPRGFSEARGSPVLLERPADETDDARRPLAHGDVVIAAITSCTNTSNPRVMIAAGLLARNAVAMGLKTKPWVKTSLAPGSLAVSDYLAAAGLQEPLDELGFHTVGYGCTTCMGNSGPLAPAIEREILQRDLFVSAVLSGNRNFENRIHPLAKANYLAAPPLVVAYAIVGTVLVDLTRDPIGKGRDGRNVYLRDIWPTDDEIRTTTAQTVSPELYRAHSRNRSAGSGQWERLSAPAGITFDWDPRSTYIRCPPFLDGISREAPVGGDICEARVLLLLGDSVTTDHISPVGAIPVNGPAGRYLGSCGIAAAEFNSFMSRRVNHDVMIRGTFANPLLRNEMTAGETQGGRTRYMPDGTVMPVYDAAMRYAEERVPLIVIAGKEYGGGSSRDWAAKGARLLGIRAVLAESFERIHRTNLVGMGVLPLEFRDGATRKTLALEGSERFDIRGLESGLGPRANITCTITRADGTRQSIQLLARIDTALEAAWYRNGGVLPFALRTLLSPTLR